MSSSAAVRIWSAWKSSRPRVEGGHLTIDDAGPCRDSRERATQHTEALGAVVSVLGVEAHNAAVLVQLDAPAVERSDKV